MKLLLIFVVVAVVGITNVRGYGIGAPTAACEGAKPKHRNQTSGERIQPLPPAENPFRFLASVTEYTPEETLTVSIEVTNGAEIHGFFLQARGVGSNTSYGSFLDPLPAKSQLRPCQGTADAVTHTDPTAKGDLMTFTWQAPPADTGSIRFLGTVALNHDEFYADIESDVIAEGSSAASTLDPVTASSTLVSVTSGAVQIRLAAMTMGVVTVFFSLISLME